jgi:hypothetical protein
MQTKVVLVAVLLTVMAYWAWLGWDRQRNPDGTGPYEAWQVVGLALTLMATTAAASWRSADVGQSLVVAVLMAAALTVPWSLDWATEKTVDANLWMVGAIFLFGGTTAGLWVLAALTRAVRQWTHRH